MWWVARFQKIDWWRFLNKNFSSSIPSYLLFLVLLLLSFFVLSFRFNAIFSVRLFVSCFYLVFFLTFSFYSFGLSLVLTLKFLFILYLSFSALCVFCVIQFSSIRFPAFLGLCLFFFSSTNLTLSSDIMRFSPFLTAGVWFWLKDVSSDFQATRTRTTLLGSWRYGEREKNSERKSW